MYLFIIFLFIFQVTVEDDVKNMIAVAKEKYGTLNVAVNCAGIAIAVKTLSKKGAHPLDQYEKVLKVCPCRTKPLTNN